MTRSLSVVSAVAKLAPVRHTVSQGTSSPPHTERPRIDGRPYVTLTVAPPTLASTESAGDGIPIGLAFHRAANAGTSTAATRSTLTWKVDTVPGDATPRMCPAWSTFAR